ncbi:hypothetical protein DIPPA_63032 [Diplonema papillatum]|nr:hypothetical protein DIPPA_63032 [Diplonema papillatum]
MGHSEDVFVDNDRVSSKLKCSICLLVVEDAMFHVVCQNGFCKECIGKVSACPICRRGLKDGLVPDITRRELVLELAVRCPNNVSFRCPWTGTLDSLGRHVEACNESWKEEQCSDCGETFHAKDRQRHEESCRNRQACCKLCKKRVSFTDLLAHIAVCPKLEVQCPNEGCSVSVAHSLLSAHLQNCTFAMVPCPHFVYGCTERMVRRRVREHQLSCRFVSKNPLFQRCKSLETTVLELKGKLLQSSSNLETLTDFGDTFEALNMTLAGVEVQPDSYADGMTQSPTESRSESLETGVPEAIPSRHVGEAVSRVSQPETGASSAVRHSPVGNGQVGEEPRMLQPTQVPVANRVSGPFTNNTPARTPLQPPQFVGHPGQTPAPPRVRDLIAQFGGHDNSSPFARAFSAPQYPEPLDPFLPRFPGQPQQHHQYSSPGAAQHVWRIPHFASRSERYIESKPFVDSAGDVWTCRLYPLGDGNTHGFVTFGAYKSTDTLAKYTVELVNNSPTLSMVRSIAPTNTRWRTAGWGWRRLVSRNRLVKQGFLDCRGTLTILVTVKSNLSDANLMSPSPSAPAGPAMRSESLI